MKSTHLGVVLCSFLFLFSGCGGINDKGESSLPFLVNRPDEFQTLLKNTQGNIVEDFNGNFEKMIPPDFFGYDSKFDINVEQKAEGAPVNNWEMQVSSVGKGKSNAKGIMNMQIQDQTSFQVTGKIPTPVGNVQKVNLETDVRVDGDSLFFLLKNIGITMEDGQPFSVDFSSIVGTFYESTITNILTEMGQTPEKIEELKKSSATGSGSLANVLTSIKENPLFVFQEFKEEKGAQRVYAVTLNNESLKKIYGSLIPPQLVGTAQEAEIKGIEELSFAGNLTLSQTDAQFMELDGILSLKNETEKKKVHIKRSAEGFLLALSTEDGSKEELALEKTATQFVIRSGGGTTLNAQIAEGKISGNITNPASTIATFSFVTENGKTNGTMALAENNISIILSNFFVDFKKGMSGDISFTAPGISGKMNINGTITPLENISIEKPEGARPLEEFKNAALAIGISVMTVLQNQNTNVQTSPEVPVDAKVKP